MAVIQTDGILSSTGPGWGSRIAGAGLTWYDGLTQDYAAIYRTQPNVRLVVSFLARNIAQVPLNAFERVSSTQRQSLGDHDLGAFLRIPNEAIGLTHFDFIQQVVSDLKIYDEFFAVKVRNEVTGKLRVLRLPPNEMQVVEQNAWQVTRWRWTGLPGAPEFDIDELIFLHGYNPDDIRRGLSPLEAARQILAEDRAAGEYREQFWKSGARISGVIERPAPAQGTPKWSPEARDNFELKWAARYSGSATGAGGTPLLEDGMHFNQIAFSAKDSEYLGARRLSREETAAIYHVSPVFVGILDNANFSNVKEQHRGLYQDTLGPDLRSLAEILHVQLLPEFPDLIGKSVYFEFDLKEKLKGSFEEEAAAQQTSVGAPWRTRNEARADDNLPPIPGGDEIVTPLNVLIGGQASPTDSAPPIGQNARKRAGKTRNVKAADELPDDVKEWFDEHVDMLTSTFDRQSNAVVAALGGGASIESVWDDARWNGELKADFLELAQSMGTDIGQKTADAFNGTFDPDVLDDYLTENSRIASESVNDTTKQQIANLDQDDDDFLDNVRNIFAVAASSRAAQIAVTRVTGIGNFARKEGAQQGGAISKVWDVRSSRSRHPNLNGQKVGIDEEFSNGARWPGDHSLSEDERAGCVCSMSFE